jgi:hypothetical protein
MLGEITIEKSYLSNFFFFGGGGMAGGGVKVFSIIEFCSSKK